MRTRPAGFLGALALILMVPNLVHGANPITVDSAATGPMVQAVRLHPPAAPVTVGSTLIDLVNAERAARGLPPMVADAKLELAAQRHSEDQALHQSMSHTGSDGSTLAQRVDRVGFSWRSIAENVAYGYATPADVMAAWMISSGHRANILSANTRIGVGLAYGANGQAYWTQVFATPM
jgi:uncharacterized protein YkwD